MGAFAKTTVVLTKYSCHDFVAAKAVSHDIGPVEETSLTITQSVTVYGYRPVDTKYTTTNEMIIRY